MPEHETANTPPPPPVPPPQRGEFLGLPLDPAGQDDLIDWLLAATPGPRVAAYLNAHTVNLAAAINRRKEAASPWNKCDLVYADGMAVVRAARQRGIPVPERVSGADFFARFCWAAAARGRSIALVGAEEPVVRQCALSLETNIPGLNIVLVSDGYHGPGSREREQVVARLEAARPDVILLGMGSPAQEEFALEMKARGNVRAIWCVGALFEYGRTRSRAPVWMRQAGLEWLYRLALEPRRLAGRYIAGNLLFLLRTRGLI